MMSNLAFDLQDNLDTRIEKIEKKLCHLLSKKYTYMNRYKDEKWLDNLLSIEKGIFTNERLLKYFYSKKAENDQP
jgi:hypothetical protein